jgi:hypothetical protein
MSEIQLLFPTAHQGTQSVSDSDSSSIEQYGQLAATISTTLRNQGDAEDQAEFYLTIRAQPQFALRQITFPLASSEIPDAERDDLLNVFMGLAISVDNLPANMVNGTFLGFVEGWTWTASLNQLNLTMNVSPLEFSLQAFRWTSLPNNLYWQDVSPTLDWQNATIVG